MTPSGIHLLTYVETYYCTVGVGKKIQAHDNNDTRPVGWLALKFRTHADADVNHASQVAVIPSPHYHIDLFSKSGENWKVEGVSGPLARRHRPKPVTLRENGGGRSQRRGTGLHSELLARKLVVLRFAVRFHRQTRR